MVYRLKLRVILKAIRTTTADVNPSEFTGRRVHERFIKARLWSDDGAREKCVQQFSDVNLVVALRENEHRGSTESAGVVLGDSGLLKVKEDDRSDVKVVVTFQIQWFAFGCWSNELIWSILFINSLLLHMMHDSFDFCTCSLLRHLPLHPPSSIHPSLCILF